MARRSDHTREELMALAIEASLEIIENEGLSGLSARKVAKEIGYTVGTIYNVFGSHDLFLLHINAATLDDIYNHLKQSINTGKPGIEGLKMLANAYVTFATTHTSRWSALFEFTLSPEATLPDWYSDKIKALFILVEEQLRAILSDDKHNISQTAKILWAGIQGICQLGLTGKLEIVQAEPVQALTDSLIEHYVKGLLS